jgi:antagonist of KipI
LIVLMRDCQTTGGYPRVLQLTEKAINTLSQKLTGSALKISLKD